jgi:hypothetical protein
MKTLFLTLLLATLCATGYGQTIKALGYNTTNGYVIGPTSGILLFTNDASFPTASASTFEILSDLFVADEATLTFDGEGQDDWRSALGLGATWLTNTNVTNFRTAIGLGATNEVQFGGIIMRDGDALKSEAAGNGDLFVNAGNTIFSGPIEFNNSTNIALTRTNLGAARAPIWVYKATNQTNATTNLVSDTALTFTAAANTKYAVELFLIIESGAEVVGARILTSNSPTVFGYWNSSDPANAGFTSSGIAATNTGSIFFADASEPAALLHKFTVVGPTNTNAPITLEFANQSTNGTAIIGAGSYLKAEVIE